MRIGNCWIAKPRAPRYLRSFESKHPEPLIFIGFRNIKLQVSA